MRRGAPGNGVEPVRVLRIIARLNVGGPTIQAISLTGLLAERGYETTLVRGTEGPREGNMDPLAAAMRVRPRRVRSLRRDTGPRDVLALASLVAILARNRPHVVHSHAAKAGALGRAAALLVPGRRRRVIVHTYHGHSLRGYFSSPRERAFMAIERFLARHSDRLVAVSAEVRDELVEMGVAPSEHFRVIRLGFDLSPFVVGESERRARAARLRRELGIPEAARVVTLVARLVPIKRVDRFLEIANRLRDRDDVHFLIVGDGELNGPLRASAPARKLDGRLTWTGFRRDIPDVLFATDVAVLTSDNEGTPVSLIEALAAGVPVVSTRVGGVATVVRDGDTGLVADPDDHQGLAAAVARLLDDPVLARELSHSGHRHALESFSVQRLVSEIDALYRELLLESGLPAPVAA